jgi:signal transduction histidine kinase
VRLADLFRATAFRLALNYLGLFTVSAVALLGLVSWSTSLFIEWQIQETVEADAGGLSERYREGGLRGLADLIEERVRQEGEGRSIYLLVAPDGTRIAGNLYGWPARPPDAEGWVRFRIERIGNRATTAIAHAFFLSDGYRLLVGRSMNDVERVKLAINRALGWGLALTILLGMIGGYFASRQMVQRVEAMSRTARRIVGGDMGSRMGLSGSRDEFDQLAQSFNEMMDEIEHLVESLRTVTDNIAHDLRTPLNRLRSRIDLALMSPAEGEAQPYRRALEESLTEADNLLATFNALLAISQAESGARLNGFERLDPALLVRDVVELYEPLAEQKGVSLSAHLEDWPAEDAPAIAGDRHMLFQALANLVDNAVKYAPSDGEVGVSLIAEPGWHGHAPRVEMVVADNGPGVPESDRDRVLDRFVRLDSTRTTPGNGLGLSLVNAVARLHGADLILEDNKPGLKVRLRFPPATIPSEPA